MRRSEMIQKAADECSDEIFGCHVHLSVFCCNCRVDEDAVRKLIEVHMLRLVADITATDHSRPIECESPYQQYDRECEEARRAQGMQ